MRLEPVYLVAPEPAPQSMPTRRTFLLIGGAFLGGTVLGGAVLGGACGYTIGAVRSGDGERGEEQPGAPDGLEWEPSEDADLGELRRLAVKAPIEELMGKVVLFLNLRVDTYRQDLILWAGVRRIANEIIAQPDPKVHWTTIATVAGQIEKTTPPQGVSCDDLLPALRGKLAERKRKQ